MDNPIDDEKENQHNQVNKREEKIQHNQVREREREERESPTYIYITERKGKSQHTYIYIHMVGKKRIHDTWLTISERRRTVI